MAYIPKNYNEEEDDSKQGQGQNSGIPGEGQTSFVQAGSENARSGKHLPNRGGDFVNFQNYVQANQSKSPRLGDKVGQGIKGTLDSAQNKIQDTFSSYRDRANQNKLFDTDPMRQNIKSNNFNALNNNYGSQWNQLQSGYQGPRGISEQDEIALAAEKRKAFDTLDQIKDKDGFDSLLRTTVGDPTYRKGESILDKSLLMGDPQARQKFSEFEPQREALKSLYDTEKRNLNTLVGEQDTQWTDQAKELRDLLGTQSQNYVKSLRDRAKEYTDDSFQVFQDIQRGMLNTQGAVETQNRDLAPYDLRQVDPTPFFKKGDTSYSIADVATEQDLAQLKALEALGLGGIDIGQKRDSSDLGFEWDSEGYRQAVAQEQARRDQALSDFRNQYKPDPVPQTGVPNPGQLNTPWIPQHTAEENARIEEAYRQQEEERRRQQQSQPVPSPGQLSLPNLF